MKVVLLAGGFGTRLAEYTESIPKPMVPIEEGQFSGILCSITQLSGIKIF